MIWRLAVNNETTLAIVKPDAFGKGKAGLILAHLEAEGFELVAARIARLREVDARAFYAVHSERPFYGSLVEFMTSGPCMPIALQRETAVAHLAEAAAGTVRALFAESKERNAIHASDSVENAAVEVSFFFAGRELI
jgi:nucleoside-diphosphate kinase